MSKYDGYYVKIARDSTFWAVTGGKRRIVHDAEDMYEIGLRPVITISVDELREIEIGDAPKAGYDEEE